LLLFGTEDGVTKRTLGYYQDDFVEGNIKFKHVAGASHVTPCMDSVNQLSKLEEVISFYREINNLASHAIVI
jgi:hypothetical protein